MLEAVEFPELVERTGRFTYGAPRDISVAADGARVVFLRSPGPTSAETGLWVLNVATAAERLVVDGPVTSYATDPLARFAAVVVGDRLLRADLVALAVDPVPVGEPVTDARPDPTGTLIGYVTAAGCLRIVRLDGADELLAGESDGFSWRDPGGVRWGVPDAAGLDFGRDRGWWWSPDGMQILAARVARTVSLHLLDLEGGWVDVHWDRETYPYLVDARWGENGGPLLAVLRRTQQHGLVLSVDPRTGETQVHAELADARWVEPVPGTPRYLPDGRVLVGGELAHDGFDARCLFADGTLLTPGDLYIRRVLGVLPRSGSPAAGPDLLVEGNAGDPSAQHVIRISTSLAGGGVRALSLTPSPGWHRGEVGGDVLVIDGTVWRGDARIAELRSHAEPMPYAPHPVLERVTDRRLPTAVLYPSRHVSGSQLPVLLVLGDGPLHQQVTLDQAAWQERQWWADAGFAVVAVDGRGTPGRAPSFEKAVHRRLADVALGDRVDALHAVVGKHPDLDLDRVAVRGTGLGGWLAGIAVLRHPDVFRCAVAREPTLDWADLPPAFAERYLGRPIDSPDLYAHHSLREEPLPEAFTVLGPGVSLTEELEIIRAALR